MGFCRMCGNIVTGPRCKCGGLAVKPSVDFSFAQQPDVWSRKYARSTENSPSASHARERCTTLPSSASRPPSELRKLRRPQSTFFERPTGEELSAHVDTGPLHNELLPDRTGDSHKGKVDFPSSPDDIFADPNTLTLSKAYGSVLQPKETLTAFTCFICSDPFPPDATIYPDPSDPTTTTRFLCKSCFATNGGAKGNCQSCFRPILILASEGGFIENGGRLWHKGCFRCDGCFKNISDNPMVDLLGKPSCEDCFDSCLKRPRADSTSSKRFPSTPDKYEARSNIGGMKRSSRESSPALEELQQRLGISKSRESTPLTERSRTESDQSPLLTDLTQRLAKMTTPTSNSQKPSISDGSPTGRYARFRRNSHITSKPSSSTPIFSPSPRSDSNAVQEMERRLSRLSGSVSSSSQSSMGAPSSTPSLTEVSDSASVTSHLTTPPSSPPVARHAMQEKTPTQPISPLPTQDGEVRSNALLNSPSTPCSKCAKPLFRTRGGGKFVTVPEESSKHLPAKCFHVECFRCAICDKPFEETKHGQAIFVRSSSGCCHVNCATPERIVIRPVKPKASMPSPISSSPTKLSRPPPSAPASIGSFPRFGTATTCPGCRVSVSIMERGVVPGPQGSRWHAPCLVCGGKGLKEAARRDPNVPGCGKRLDSAAKTDGDGGVWCRECLLLVSSGTDAGQGSSSSIHTIEPSFTGGDIFGRFPGTSRGEGIAPQTTGTTTLARQLTGTTTIARQFTGMSALTNQLTGGGLSPTRQLPRDINRSPSPTKMMLSNSGSGRRVPFPRPRSMVGARGKSFDEGRGMFLVRQMTGGGAGDSGL